MGNGDVDDIFKDFEHKVEGKEEADHASKKETHKSPQQLGEEGALRQKYENAEQALNDQYKKAKESLQEKRKKENDGHGGEMHGRNSLRIEKVAYEGTSSV